MDHNLPIDPHLFVRPYLLNHGDLNGLLAKRPLLSNLQTKRLGAIQHKLKTYPDKFQASYQQVAALAAMSDWEDADNLVYCNLKQYKGTRIRCQTWKLCPYCARCNRIRKFRKHASKFYQSRWAFVTCSFGKPCSAYPEDQDRCDLYWKAGLHAIKTLKEEAFIRGAIVRQELALTRFLPLKLRPHSHALVEAHDDIDPAYIVELMGAYAHDEFGAVNQSWNPRAYVTVINTEKDFQNKIGYLFKEMDVMYAYREAWMRYVEPKPSRAEALNLEVDDFFAAYAMLSWGARQVTYMGSFHPAWKQGHGY